MAELPPFTQKIFRPAEDCSICRGVEQVDRILDVDPSIFEERYYCYITITLVLFLYNLLYSNNIFSKLFPLPAFLYSSLSLSSSWVCGGEGRYAYSGRPVVVVDAAINWTATEVFSFPFFKSLYEGVDGNCQFFPYRTEFKSLREVFEMSADRSLLEEGTEPWYVGW